MKVLKRDLKSGYVQLTVDTADDLWYLYTLIEEGDMVRGDSEYKFKLGGNDARGKVVKKRVWVKIKVEKTEFSQSTGQLRVGGIVVDGSEDVPRGSHHSIELTEGSRCSIEKETWFDYHVEKLNDAVHSSNLKTLLLLFDRESAIFALLQPNGYELLLEMKGNVQKKQFDQGKTKSFYKELTEKIEDYLERHKVQNIIAASPAFWKEYLKKELNDALAKKVIFSTVSIADTSAIPELLKRPELKQALQGERAARETKLIEELMAKLAKDKLAYGEKDIKEALKNGNAKVLVVSEQYVMKAREQERFGSVERLMKDASKMGASVHLVSTKEAMTKLDGLAGIAAVKRW